MLEGAWSVSSVLGLSRLVPLWFLSLIQCTEDKGSHRVPKKARQFYLSKEIAQTQKGYLPRLTVSHMNQDT